jgi:hypothetical protein
MNSLRPKNPLVLALWANAILLGGILVVLLARGNSGGWPSILPAAYAQPVGQAPIAGGAGVFVMPCQLADRQWGAYLMDVDAGTLVVYQYEPGVRQLRFVAARSYRNDTKLHDFSTSPSTEEIRKQIEKEKQGFRRPEENPAQPAEQQHKDQNP